MSLQLRGYREALSRAPFVRRVGHVDAQEVGGLQHLVERAALDTRLLEGRVLDERVEGDDLHAEAVRAALRDVRAVRFRGLSATSDRVYNRRTHVPRGTGPTARMAVSKTAGWGSIPWSPARC